MKIKFKKAKINKTLVKSIFRTYCVIYSVLMAVASIFVIAKSKSDESIWKWYPVDIAIIALMVAISFGFLKFFFSKYLVIKVFLIYASTSLVLFPYLWIRWVYETIPQILAQNIFFCYSLIFMFISELISFARKIVLSRRDNIIVTEREIGD